MTTPRIIGLAVIVIAIGLFFAWFWKQAGESTLNSIERQNNEAGNRADDRVLDYDACRDAGRVWNFGSGKCGRASSSSGR